MGCMPRPVVSIITPMKNGAATVAQTVASVRAQSHDAWELLVIDDDSTDDSPAMVHAAAETDSRITLIDNTGDPGVSGARNTGLDAARGEWVLFLDADDVLAPNALAVLLDRANTGDDAGDAAFGAYRVCDAQLRELYTYTDHREEVGLDDIFDRSYLWTAAHLVRRRMFTGMRFDTNLIGYEDRDVWFRLAERGVRWRCTREVVAHYRIRPGSASKNAARMLADAQRVHRGVYERCAGSPDVWGASIEPEPGRLHRVLWHLAIQYASRAAVLGDPAGAVRLFAEAEGPKTVPPVEAARAGQYAVVFGLGQWPDDDDPATAEWAHHLATFWRGISDAGLAPDTLAVEATERLGDPLRPGTHRRQRVA